ncbi:hypothetical protein E2C01_087671 [Portunus trituberculatus]|uniref:Uncharacterized protein n=1 Tax=Portunus trituberculatus TaxID=210409 RepID=A0A5B7JEP6_PORTR|nr:hypothetical protein [Portunus trituberculatus]
MYVYKSLTLSVSPFICLYLPSFAFEFFLIIFQPSILSCNSSISCSFSPWRLPPRKTIFMTTFLPAANRPSISRSATPHLPITRPCNPAPLEHQKRKPRDVCDACDVLSGPE